LSVHSYPADLATPAYCPRCGWEGPLAEANCPDDDLITCRRCGTPVMTNPDRRPVSQVTTYVKAVDPDRLPVGASADLALAAGRPIWRVRYYAPTTEPKPA
jgi:hypothetical protein